MASNNNNANVRPDLLSILTAAGFSKSEVEQFKANKLISGTLESTNERELAAKFGGIIRCPLAELSEGFMEGKRKHDPVVYQVLDLGENAHEQLSQLKLGPNREEMAKKFMKPKDTDLNLNRDEISLFEACKNADQVEETLRKVILARYQQYRELGLEGMSHYCRSRGKVYEPGEELKLKSKKAPLLERTAPDFFKVLNNYPNDKPEGFEESFTLVNFAIDDKANFCLVHKMGLKVGDDRFVMCQRHFYVSRGHNTVQGIGGCYALGEAGQDQETAFVYGSRTSTDQVAGFGGAAKRAIGAKIMTGKIAKNLEMARDKFNEKAAQK